MPAPVLGEGEDGEGEPEEGDKDVDISKVDDPATTVINDENFGKVVQDGQVWMIDFYATWCPHCQRLAPEWANAAKTAKAQGIDVHFGKVDTGTG